MHRKYFHDIQLYHFDDGSQLQAEESRTSLKSMLGAKTDIRVAGDETFGISSTQLNHPTQVIVDANEYMCISKHDSSRITRWALNSTFGVFIVACKGVSDTASTDLNGPHSLVFDSHGSLYVSDRYNNKIQKFQIVNSHREYIIYLFKTQLETCRLILNENK
jgi:hypothetical protein